MKRIALTPGEPAGIGPDLAVMLAQSQRDYELVALADAELLQARAQALNLSLTLRPFDATEEPKNDASGSLCVMHHDSGAEIVVGTLNPANAPYVLSTLDSAAAGCMSQIFDAMVTGPVHKGVINDAGISFTGHTEYLAEKTQGDPVMLLVSNQPVIRVALATTHLPLNQVAQSITKESLERVLRILHTDLQQRFGLTHPRILVCGLNPHAGEGGHLGREEIDIIEPALHSLREQGMDLIGPLPADTLFTAQHLDSADAVLAMFHDQGLPVLKHASFGRGVNVTLGLNIIRTSVDHGTALDKAGTGDIDPGSLNEATNLALQLSHNANQQLD
ncbi:MAG: 4-hydroxythreonine-4-phosphate dehydrogenase PdxA [Gammaproteobacteria bacterium]|nr:4-hydroxythreonine-4-phosphate dehydrogenase PdxA [Gammaproteobacteria bacterium]